MNTDLTYASKEDFQTDAQIAASKQNGEVNNYKREMAIGQFQTTVGSHFHSVKVCFLWSL